MSPIPLAVSCTLLSSTSDGRNCACGMCPPLSPWLSLVGASSESPAFLGPLPLATSPGHFPWPLLLATYIVGPLPTRLNVCVVQRSPVGESPIKEPHVQSFAIGCISQSSNRPQQVQAQLRRSCASVCVRAQLPRALAHAGSKERPLSLHVPVLA